MRPSLVGLLAAGLFALVTPGAHAETWSAPDRPSDVRDIRYDPGAPPCEAPTQRRDRNDRRHDITRLAVDHGTEAVVLRLSLRDVVRDDRRTSYTLYVRTPERTFFVQVLRDARRGTAQVFFGKAPDYPDPSDVEGCTVTAISTGKPCESLTGDISAALDEVTVSLPRRCLGAPPWVRVAGKVGGYTEPDEEGRFWIQADQWGRPGVQRHGFLPPFGPRVRQG